MPSKDPPRRRQNSGLRLVGGSRRDRDPEGIGAAGIFGTPPVDYAKYQEMQTKLVHARLALVNIRDQSQDPQSREAAIRGLARSL